jgi:hypothetical protein
METLHENYKKKLQTNCNLKFKTQNNQYFVSPSFAKINSYIKIIDMKSITNENKFVIVNCFYDSPINLFSFNSDIDNFSELFNKINNLK